MAAEPPPRLMADVISVGLLVADIIVRSVDRWPELGRLTLVDGIELHSGGLAHTTGVTLAKLGTPTAVVGCVGADLFGTFLIDILREHHIEAHVRRTNDVRTSTTIVMVTSNGERSFVHLPGASAGLMPGDVPDSLLARSQVMHLGGYFLLPSLDGAPAAALFQQAHALGCRTSLDTAWDAHGRWMSVLAPCFPHLDLLFGNRDELGRVTQTDDPARIAARLRERGVGIVAVKLGEEGAYVDDGRWRGRVPALSVDVIDTTGAGDAFCGGFLAGYTAGWDLERTTRFANAVGAMCIGAVGGATGIRSMAETLRFADTTPRRK